MEPIVDATDARNSGRWFGTIQDVTERMRAEMEVRESIAFVQAVEDSVLDHMAVLDRDGVIVSVNAAWLGFARRNGPEDDAPCRAWESAPTISRSAAARGEATERAEPRGRSRRSPRSIAGTRDRFSLEYACHSATRGALVPDDRDAA